MKVVSFERKITWFCDVKMRPVLSAMVWTLQMKFLPLPPKIETRKNPYFEFMDVLRVS